MGLFKLYFLYPHRIICMRIERKYFLKLNFTEILQISPSKGNKCIKSRMSTLTDGNFQQLSSISILGLLISIQRGLICLCFSIAAIATTRFKNIPSRNNQTWEMAILAIQDRGQIYRLWTWVKLPIIFTEKYIHKKNLSKKVCKWNTTIKRVFKINKCVKRYILANKDCGHLLNSGSDGGRKTMFLFSVKYLKF